MEMVERILKLWRLTVSILGQRGSFKGVCGSTEMLSDPAVSIGRTLKA